MPGREGEFSGRPSVTLYSCAPYILQPRGTSESELTVLAFGVLGQSPKAQETHRHLGVLRNSIIARGGEARRGMAWNPREWWSQRMEHLRKSEAGAGGCERCMQSRGAAGAAGGAGGAGGVGGFMIPSVKEVAEATIDNLLHHERQHGANQEEEQRLARARACTDEGVKAGLKSGLIAGVTAAVPTLVAVRVLPWAKHNLNYTAQALIVSAATIGTYFVTCEQTILACSRDASYARLAKEREAKGL